MVNDRFKELDLTKLNLLYVEDDEALRESAKDFFEIYFKNVYCAKDGVDALNIVEDNKIDIIICDISMPKLNGIEFAKIVRKKDANIPIIITTAYAKVEYLLEAVELNLITYLVKPVTEEKLFEALQKAYLKLFPIKEIKLSKEIIFFPNEQIVKIDNKEISLTKMESKFLYLLSNNSHRVVTYEEIENIVWSGEYVSKDSIRTVIKSIRKKLSTIEIKNISKTGYRLFLDI